jgi:microcystin degradation protein MlrC
MNSVRVGIAAFSQESNSFAPAFTRTEDFEIRIGRDLVGSYSGTNTELGGFLGSCQERRWAIVPIFSAWATSGGPLSNNCFEDVAGRLCALAKTGGIDALLLCLHGAMSAEGYDSADAEVTRRLRNTLGRAVPIVGTHDFHAHVAPTLLEHVDGLIGYRTYPHIDMRQTGRRAASLLDRIIAGARSRHWFLSIPMVTPAHASLTSEAPLLPIMSELNRAFPEECGVYGSVFLVQPWLDVPDVGNSIVVSECNEDSAIPTKISAIAKMLWQSRRSFVSHWTTSEDLVSRLQAEKHRPILVSEGYDAPSGGAAGDHTGILSLFLPYTDTLRCCLYLVDPHVAEQARAAGVGTQIQTELGAKLDPRWSKPVPISAKVVNLSNGEFAFRGPAYTGKQLSMGPTAVLEHGRMRIVVATRPVFMHDPELFRSQGIEPKEMDAVAVKSPMAFRVSYEDISRTILYLELPGVCSGRLESLPFRRVDRLLYPRDDFEWQPSMADIQLIRRRV